MHLPTVAVVIPTAGRRLATLESIVSSVLADPATREVIVVLDHPSPEIGYMVGELRANDPRVELLEVALPAEPERDRGQASRDAGFRAAQAEVLLALDDDLEPTFGLVSGHARHHAARSGLVVLGYSPIVPAASASRVSRAATSLYGQSYEETCKRFEEGSADPLLGLWGGHFSVRRDDWILAEQRAGVPKPGSPAAAARHIDAALGFRLRDHGLVAEFVRDLVAVHHHRCEAAQIPHDAHSRAYGRACLHRAYPELVHSPERDLASRGRRPVVIRILHSPSLSRIGLVITMNLTRAASALRLGTLEVLGVRVMSLLGFARGIQDANREFGSIAD
jgi:hypothetical protein